VAPVLLLDRAAILSRAEALELLSLDAARPVCYVQLGAGNINQIEGLESSVIEWLHDSGFRVVLGRSPIALRRLGPTPADRVITDFPNARYFTAFDLAVLAGGYNSVNEAIAFGLPTIFIPNGATGTDDQARRCIRARSFGAFEVLDEVSRDAFLAAVECLRHAATEGGTRQNVSGVNGAVQAAKIIRALI
jgi:UDP-N-acetylglucosamine--N-acetylmuramyl-(pentapeptide) pyrophosphoryl-undecaprenol N-acetylglucosamine transferase